MAPTMIVSPFIFESCLFRVRVVPPWRADFSKNILWRIFRNRAGLSVNHPRRFYVVPLCTVKKTANKGVARGRNPLHAALDRKFMATRIRARRRFAQAKNGVSTHGIRRVFPVKNKRQQKCRKTSEANSAQSANVKFRTGGLRSRTGLAKSRFSRRQRTRTQPVGLGVRFPLSNFSISPK